MKTFRILVFRTFWYPNNGPGTRRMESFVKRLAARGHTVTFLALQDNESTASVPELERCRTILVPHSIRPSSLLRRIERRLGRLIPQADFYLHANTLIERASADLIRQERFDCMVTTFQPMGSPIVANRLHRRFGIPWIADLRDLPDQFEPSRRHWLTERKAKMLGKACQSAAHLTTVSPPLKEALEQRYSITCGVTVIYNGYEDVCASSVSGIEESKTFDIAYFGVIYGGRTLHLLQQGLDLLASRGISLEGVRVRLYGRIVMSVLGLTPNAPSTALFSNLGFIAHADAMAAMRSSAVLVSLASPGAKGILTSKIFEYAVAGRPVLSIPCDHDVLDEFIHDTRIGCSCNSAEEVAGFLGGLLAEWRASGRLPQSNPDPDHLAKFSRRAQADVFAGIVERVCAVSPTHRAIIDAG